MKSCFGYSTCGGAGCPRARSARNPACVAAGQLADGLASQLRTGPLEAQPIHDEAVGAIARHHEEALSTGRLQIDQLFEPDFFHGAVLELLQDYRFVRRTEACLVRDLPPRNLGVVEDKLPLVEVLVEHIDRPTGVA